MPDSVILGQCRLVDVLLVRPSVRPRLDRCDTRYMEYCDLCDLPLEHCPHGRPEAVKPPAEHIGEILVSPTGYAHLPGCPHKGDDDNDYSEWGVIESRGAWTRLGNGEQIQATGGADANLVAARRCQTCVDLF